MKAEVVLKSHVEMEVIGWSSDTVGHSVSIILAPGVGNEPPQWQLDSSGIHERYPVRRVAIGRAVEIVIGRCLVDTSMKWNKELPKDVEV